jgi:hypothetical protein
MRPMLLLSLRRHKQTDRGPQSEAFCFWFVSRSTLGGENVEEEEVERDVGVGQTIESMKAEMRSPAVVTNATCSFGAYTFCNSVRHRHDRHINLLRNAVP